jgi:hypothetical protein
MLKKYEDVLGLLGPEPIPGNEQELVILREWTEEYVRKKGEDWVRNNCYLLRDSWDYIYYELGVPGIPHP